jgi:hypothetical protein
VQARHVFVRADHGATELRILATSGPGTAPMRICDDDGVVPVRSVLKEKRCDFEADVSRWRFSEHFSY